MSLINKMLQDIDARAGQPGAAPLPDNVRPVLAPEPRAPWRRVALGGGVLLAVAAVGAFGWRMMETPAAPVVAVADAPAPAPAPARASSAVVVAMPAAAPVQVADVAPAAPLPPAEEQSAPAPPGPAPRQPVDAKEVSAKQAAAQPAAGKLAPAKPAAAKPAPAEPAPVKPTAAKPVAAKPAAAKLAATGGGRTEVAAQRAEGAYRRALAVLEDGRVTEAIATLQAGLALDPRHEPSRQTLVGLLIEARRPDEAIRQLQAALALDPRQPSMAMLLARLQVERGGPALETLMRTLPYAAGNGGYHAFLAGVLQRDGRQHEAAEHYRTALRSAPQNGVWWMGLGISLQAEQRDAEAAAAFQQAQASGSLSAELQAFVERRLRQLGR